MTDIEFTFEKNLSKIASFMALGKRRLVMHRSSHRRGSTKIGILKNPQESTNGGVGQKRVCTSELSKLFMLIEKIIFLTLNIFHTLF